jgi:hypothetical protein
MKPWLMVLFLGACGGEGLIPATDAGERVCPLPGHDGWVCVDATADCISPEGKRQTVWERPIYCCDGELVAPGNAASGSCPADR